MAGLLVLAGSLAPAALGAFQEVQVLSDWGSARVDARAVSEAGESLGDWSGQYTGTLDGLTAVHLDRTFETETGYGWLGGDVAPRSTLLDGFGLETRAAGEEEGLDVWARSEATFAWRLRIGHESVPFWAAGFSQGGLLEFRFSNLTSGDRLLDWHLTDYAEDSAELKLIPYHEYELRIHSLAESHGPQDPRAWAEFAFEAIVHAPEPTSALLLLAAAPALLRRPRHLNRMTANH